MKKKDTENRRFRRYKKRYPARVIKEKQPHGAEIFDYSLDGIGVLMGDSFPINKGDVVTINNKDLSLDTPCEVRWLCRTRTGFRVGLRKLDDLKGNLKDFRLSDVFIGLQRSLKTGVLCITSAATDKKIYIKNGDLIFAASNQNEDRLGDILLREGSISQADFDRSSELIRSTGKRQGAILVELGAVTPKQLFEGVKHQVTAIILSLFGLEDGEFKFLECPLPTEEVITLRLSAGSLIYQGVKRLACVAQVKDYLDLPPDTVLVFSEDPLNLFQDIPFEEDDKRILSFINGKRTLGEIIFLSGLYEPKVRRSVAALLSTLLIDIIEEEGVECVVSPEEVVSKPATQPAIVERIEEMFRRYPTLNYYAILGVNEYAGNAEIRSAFYSLAREFHPDRHFYLDRDMKGKLHQIFSAITDAYDVLSSPEKKDSYDGELSGRQKAGSRDELARRRFEEGESEYQKGNFESASRCFGEAASLSQSVAQYHLFHGLALAKLGNLREAERSMTKAHRLDPQNDEVLSELGHLYLTLGFPLRARRNFKKALELNTANERAKEGLTEETEE